MKKLTRKGLALVLSLAMLAGSVTVVHGAEADLTDHLTGYWNFENVEGTTVHNEVANGKDGVVSGTGVSVAESELGHALRFSSTADGRMTVSSVLNVQNSAFSISMWYKVDMTANRGGENITLLQQSGNGRSLLLLTPSNVYRTFINNSNVDSDSTVDVEQWQHITYTYNPASNKVRFYINGELDSEKDAGTDKVNELTDLLIGHHKSSSKSPIPMRGDIDEIRLYNKEVTAEEAMAIYADKAGPFVFDMLTNKIKEAQELYNSGGLAETEEAAQNLKAKIEDAGKLTKGSSFAEIQKMLTELEEAVKAYHSGRGIILSIDMDNVRRTVDGSIFGINHRYAYNGYGTFDTAEMKVKDEFAALYREAGFGSIRYPGGTISNLFQWKNTIGPIEDRVGQIHGFYNTTGGPIAPNFGLSEIATFAQENGSEIVYVYGIGRGSAQDAADLVEYLNAPADGDATNPNGGVDWAEVRAKYGHSEPFNVRYFEIGNETQQGGDDGTASQQYWMGYAGGAENAYVNGATATFTKQYAVCKDNWNRNASPSDGSKNLTRYMRYANPNPMSGEDGKELLDDFKAVNEGSVHIYVGDAEWTIVDDFNFSSSTDKHVTVDYRDGSFTFGDGVHGAIPAAGQSITVSYTVKRDGFVQISKALKETMAEIDESKGCYVYSSYETQGFIKKMNDGGFDEYYDGLTIHPYSGTPSGSSANPGQFYDSAMSLAEATGIKRVQNYVDMLPEGKVPVISEYGIFRSTDPLVRSQTHAIYIAKVIMEYVRLGSPYIQKHCLIDWYSSGADALGPTQQAVIQAVPQNGASTATGEGEFKFFSTPSARVFEMFNTSFGDQILDSSFSVVDKLSNGVQAYSALASKDEEGNVYAAIVNVDRENAKTINVDFGDAFSADGKTVEVQKLEADYTAENTLDKPNNVAVARSSFVNEGDGVSLEVKPHSFVVFKVINEEETEKTLSSIEVTPPAKVNYTKGQKLDLTGMVVNAVYDDGSKKDVTKAAKVTGYDAQKTGKQKVTVSYGGKTAEFEVIVTEEEVILESIKVTAPAKVVYEKGEELQLDGMVVKAVYSDGSEIDVTAEAKVTGYDAQKLGKQKLTVHYDEKTAEFEVTVIEPQKDPDPVNKDSLQKKVGEYAQLKREDYTTATWNAFEKAMRTAEEALADTLASQEEIDAAEKALDVAKEALLPAKIPFIDVNYGENGDWYYDTVADVYDKGLMTGKTSEVFAPAENLVRAQFAVILWRMEGEPQIEYDAEAFPDVPDNQFYTKAVLWAAKNGIVNGYSNTGNFGPSDNITREQMAVMMYRYAEYKKYDLSKKQELDSFPDAGSVTGFATDAVKWCTAMNIITGDGGKLNPQGSTNRAVCATIISRFVKAYEL